MGDGVGFGVGLGEGVGDADGDGDGSGPGVPLHALHPAKRTVASNVHSARFLISLTDSQYKDKRIPRHRALECN